MVKIYNTLSKNKEFLKFKKNIVIYVCGITVYDNCHIGHARTFLFFDAFIRYLRSFDINVTFIRNITDIDDKILEKVYKKKISFRSITKQFIKRMHIDFTNLNLVEPSFEPKATFFINKMIELVSFLKVNFYAYVCKKDIYYNVKKNCSYGRLSKRFLSRFNEPNEVIHHGKLNEEDFVVWKNDNFFKKWKFFLGYGRPGWHTECAAMSIYYAKDFIDIHSGGVDLLFPHHENELSQTLVFKGYDIIKLWMHIGQLKFENKKMSKSLNNFVLIKDFLKMYDEEHLRFFFFLKHYRKPLNFSNYLLKKTNKALDSLYEILLLLGCEENKVNIYFKNRFCNSMNDDLNTAKSISILFEILNKIRKLNNVFGLESQSLIYTIKFLGNMIGLLKRDPSSFLRKKTFISADVLNLVEKRNMARLNYNWKLADKIRNNLIKLGFNLKDTKNFTFIEFVN